MRARLACGVAGIATSLAAVPAEATFPGRDGRIAAAGPFGCETRTRIVTMRTDGSDRRRLTRCGASDPDWAPDGARMLLFSSLGPSVMAADGSNLTAIPLAPEPPLAGDPMSFAPDGMTFAYTRRESGRVTVWRARLDGGGDRRVGRGTLPRWSPRGGVIAVAGQLGGLSLIRARDGTTIRRLDGARVAALDWAPGGRRLVYSRVGPRDDDLFVIRADGTERKRLTRTPSRSEIDAVWSPTGGRIAFVRVRGTAGETSQKSIWTMTAAGDRPRRIFNGPAEHLSEERQPAISWRPRPG